MTHEKFDALIKRLEGYAREHPGGYRVRVGLLGMLGYAYIFMVLMVVMLIIVLMALMIAQGFVSLVVTVGWLFLLFAGMTLRALWVNLPKPTGIELSRTQVPRLFDWVAELSASLKTPPIHHVLLTGENNAAVRQIPRFGFLGWQTNYLVLGLPLMQTLSPQQFRAILAHELGHLSGHHGRFASWIYRISQMWWRLLTSFETQGHWGSQIYQGFFKWYAPFFFAYSYVLSRTHEYEADRCAAEQSTAWHAAEALVTTAITESYLNAYFWPSLRKQAAKQAEPPADSISTQVRMLPPNIEPNDAKIWLQQALLDKTYHLDTHPSLSDRLSALGFPTAANGSVNVTPYLDMFIPAKETAAQYLLGQTAEGILPQLNRAWQKEAKTEWQQLHQAAQESQQQLAKLETKAQQQTLTPEEFRQRVALTVDFKDNETALSLLREMLTAQPDDPSANFLLGRILLEQNAAAGIPHLEKAMAREPYIVAAGCELVARFLKQKGKTEEAERYQERGAKSAELFTRAKAERSTVNAHDKFHPPQLAEAEIESLRQQIARAGIVSVAYLVRKEVAYLPEKPFYVLGVMPYASRHELRMEGDEARFAARLAQALRFPSEAIIIVLNDSNRDLEQAFRQIDGARIYSVTYS